MKRKWLPYFISAILWLMVFEGIARYGLGKWFGPIFQTYLTYDSSKGWRPRPNGRYLITSKAKNFVFDAHMNAAGFRVDGGMQGYSNPVPALVVLGDSNAFGFGLKSNETFPARLAQALRDLGVSDRGVLNAGCPGYDCVQPVLQARQMGWAPEQLYVFLVHPVNDLVNTANQIDYSAYKPFLGEVNGAIRIFPPPRGLAQATQRFSPDFDRLNQCFDLRPDAGRLMDEISRLSALAFIMHAVSTMEWYGNPVAENALVWDDMPGEEFVAQTMAAISNSPLLAACRFWPEIEQFAQDRARLIAEVGSLYAEINQDLLDHHAKMLVVLAPEPFRQTAFHRQLTGLIQSLLPGFSFQWGSSALALREELQRRGVPVLCPEYDPARVEDMYIALDGHTSSQAYAVMAAGVAKIFIGECR